MTEKETHKDRPLHPAEIAKAEAEARKFDAEAKAAIITAEGAAALAVAQAKVQEALLTETSLKLVELGFNADRATEKRKEELAAHKYHHIYLFKGAVDDSTAAKCMDQLTLWMRNEPKCDIEIVFNSPGGSITAGLALWDHIQFVRAAGHKVTTSTIGMAASMAGILLQAGDVRVMGKESWLLIHQASFSTGGSFGEVEDTVKWIERIQDRILEIFAARSKMTKAQIKRKWHRSDWWISSDEALKLGLVDELR
jgi:ATP-dependent Clp endopeptidase proteolytic subunit ClpP